MGPFGPDKQIKMGSKILNFGLVEWPNHLDPRKIHDNTALIVLSQVFEKPLRITRDGTAEEATLEPSLLEALPVPRTRSDGKQIWTARVRTDVLFSDGIPLTAETMAVCLSTTDLGNQYKMQVHGSEISFVLDQPNPHFPLQLAAPYCGIFRTRDSHFLGTGPFELMDDPDDECISLKRNGHYHGSIALDGINFWNTPKDSDGRPTELVRGLETGRIHMTDGLSRSDVSSLPGIPRSLKPGNSTAILHINCERVSDPHLRRAIATALDRRALAAVSYENPLAFTASGPLPPIFAPVPDRLRTSLDSARSELTRCTSPIPEKLRLLEMFAPRPYLPHPRRISNEIVRQLASLGLEVEIVTSEDYPDYYAQCQDADYELTVSGWIADTSHPADFLEANLGSHCLPQPGTRPGYRFNLSRYQDPKMDQAIDDYRKGNSLEARIGVSERLAEDTPILALLYGPSVIVHLPSVRGFEHRTNGDHCLASVDLVEEV